MECSCNVCRSACSHKPGWFAPGEAVKAAEFLGLSFEDFFKQYLAVDWWQAMNRENDVFVLAPAITIASTGTLYPAINTGRCVFFKEGKCSIHPVKPKECREWDHTKVDGENPSRIHLAVVDEWRSNQQEVVDALGYKPMRPDLTIVDVVSLLLSRYT